METFFFFGEGVKGVGFHLKVVWLCLCRLFGLWGMWLVIPQNVGTLCSVMVHWCLCWHSLRILPNCPCWGMQPGLCPTSAVANLNLHLSRCFPLCLLYVSSFCLYTAIDDSRVGSFLISSSYTLCFLIPAWKLLEISQFLWELFLMFLLYSRNLHCQHWSASSIQMMRKFWPMLAGLSHTSLMGPMTRSRQ